MVRKGDMMDIKDVIEILAIKLLGVIPDDESIIVSTNRGEPLVLNGHSRAYQAYRNIVMRLEGEEVPFLSFESDGWVGRLRKLVRLDRSDSRKQGVV